MPDAILLFGEGTPTAPPDDTNLVCVIGVCPGITPGTAGTPIVYAIDDINTLGSLAPVGDAAELTFKIGSRSRRRVLLVPCIATIAAVLGAVTQVGTGPLVTLSSATGAPYDDAALIVKVHDAGAPGTGTFDLSFSGVVTRGLMTPTYQATKTIPARTQAAAIGTIDLTTLLYATAGSRVGTVDLTTLTYGAGGTLAGLTLIINNNVAGPITTTFVAPANAAAVVSQINTAMALTIASLNQQNQLVLTSTTIGSASTLALTAATSLVALGLTTTTGTGVAGTLDGLTLLLTADTGGAQTITFTPPPANAAAVAAKVTAGINLLADVYTTSNKLRVQSITVGATSSLNITGGTGRVAVGLAIPTTAYVGTESSYLISHLGVTINFGSGNYIANTTYSATARAGKPDLTEISARIDQVITAGYDPAVYAAVSYYDATTALAMATALDTKMIALQSQQRYPRARLFVDPTETSANVRNIISLSSLNSRWVDISARGSYIAAGQNPGGGAITRSQGWNAIIIDSAGRFSSDLGEHGENPLLDCLGITENESTAATKLVSTSGLSINVIDGRPGKFFFAGGYSSALPPSRWVDQSTRNVIQRGAVIVQARLNMYQNKTGLACNTDDTLSEAQCVIIDEDLRGSLEAALVPLHALAAAATVSRTEPFFSTKALIATMVLKVAPPARTVRGTLSPGNITATVGNGVTEVVS